MIHRFPIPLLVAAPLVVLAGFTMPAAIVDQTPVLERPPNIIYILADDLGYGELGCYGQDKIRTPNIDRLAAEGIRFTQHYSGSPVCAPSRCTLLTGLHTGHSFIRANSEIGNWDRNSPEGQLPIPADTVTVAELLKQAGYATGVVGKWGLGGPETSGLPNRQGFDFWYGYLCQRLAHNYYPEYLWRNEQKHLLDNEYFKAHQKIESPHDTAEGWDRYSGIDYAPDLMTEEALGFIRDNKSKPFFLYYATPIPHVAIQVPEDSLNEYLGAFEETPYLGQKGYLPHPAPRAGYAAMITRMDREIGRITALVDELGLGEDTIIMFSSDNGATFNGGSDREFFKSNAPLRGMKTQLWEGGIRVPFVARWTGHIQPGQTSDHISALWDFLPTACDLAGVDTPHGLDGLSFLPSLLGEDQAEHDHLYWEYRGWQVVRMGDWKAVRKRGEETIELYNLRRDIAETTDLASEYPDVIERARDLMQTGRTESAEFPLQ